MCNVIHYNKCEAINLSMHVRHLYKVLLVVKHHALPLNCNRQTHASRIYNNNIVITNIKQPIITINFTKTIIIPLQSIIASI